MCCIFNTIKTVICKALSVVLALCMMLSNGLNGIFNGDIYPYESNTKVMGPETVERSQGVTTDGQSWIFSGKNSLLRVSLDNKTRLAVNHKAIPEELKEKFGSAHIGGISYCDGLIYAPVEDSKVWEHPVIALYNAETLEYTGKYAELPADIMTRGISWLACDKENRMIYSSHSKNAEELHCFSLDTFEYVKSIKLSEPVKKIQGGEVYEGLVYVGTNDATRAVYTIDLKTGKTVKIFDRIMYQPKLIDNFGGEGEDLTILPMEDGTLIHTLDIGALFIDSNLRHYKWQINA